MRAVRAFVIAHKNMPILVIWENSVSYFSRETAAAFTAINGEGNFMF
jgi:hypothetical protein